MIEVIQENSCLNCGTDLTGKFCTVCGQKQLEPNERTFKHFVFQFFGSAFFLENNFLKSLWVLIRKPGLQSLDYIEGRRKRWMPPISIFLLINLVFFVINAPSDFNLSLADQLNYQLHSGLVKPWIDNRLDERQISLRDYETAYKRKSDTLAKTIIIINVPITALFFVVWFYKRKMFFVDHFVFFIHFYAWLLLVGIVFSFLFDGLMWAGLLSSATVQKIAPRIVLTLILIYLGLSIRKVYNQRKIISLPACILFALIALAGTHILYRFLLFVVTFWTT